MSDPLPYGWRCTGCGVQNVMKAPLCRRCRAPQSLGWSLVNPPQADNAGVVLVLIVLGIGGIAIFPGPLLFLAPLALIGIGVIGICRIVGRH